VFADYKGAKSREALANLKPIGTGPYRFVDFKPGDLLKGELNPQYHVVNKPSRLLPRLLAAELRHKQAP
jgi:peptide/nickel transport system substrate-binding protein